MIFAGTDIFACKYARTALAHDDVAALGVLPRKELYTKVFCVGVGKIFGGTACFFMRHTI